MGSLLYTLCHGDDRLVLPAMNLAPCLLRILTMPLQGRFRYLLSYIYNKNERAEVRDGEEASHQLSSHRLGAPPDPSSSPGLKTCAAKMLRRAEIL